MPSAFLTPVNRNSLSETQRVVCGDSAMNALAFRFQTPCVS